MAAHFAVAGTRLGFENVYAYAIKKNDFLDGANTFKFSLQDVYTPTMRMGILAQSHHERG